MIRTIESRIKSAAFRLMAALVSLVAVTGCHTDVETVGEAAPKNRQERMNRSPNYENGRFVNAVPTRQVNVEELWPALRDQIVPGRASRPLKPLPTVAVGVSAFETTSGLQVVWLGHSTVLARVDGTTILIDPIFDEKVLHQAGAAVRFQPPPLVRDSLPNIDAVVISHDHFDHLEMNTVQYLAPKGSVFFVPLGVGAQLEQWNVSANQIVELDWWESAEFRSLSLVCSPARHFSGRSLSAANKTLWASWTIIGPEHRLFYSGDTGYSEHFEQVGSRFGPFDLTLLQIGAYGEAWPDIHIGPEEAVAAHLALRGRKLLPVHWGTFDLAAHPWDEPIRRFVRAAEDKGIEIVTPRLGEVLDFERSASADRWWRGLE